MRFVEQASSAGAGTVKPADLAPSNATGAAVTAGCVLLTAAALRLAASDNTVFWICGEVLLSLALVQWFVLIHEAGHLTLFRSRTGNVVAGHVAGFFAVIPFESWR